MGTVVGRADKGTLRHGKDRIFALRQKAALQKHPVPADGQLHDIFAPALAARVVQRQQHGLRFFPHVD